MAIGSAAGKTRAMIKEYDVYPLRCFFGNVTSHLRKEVASLLLDKNQSNESSLSDGL